MGYIYIIATLLLTAYGQLILKWRLNFLGAIPSGFKNQVSYFFTALTDIYILSSFAAAFLASLTWMAALTRFNLSFAYPFMSLSFVIVLFLGAVFLHEPLKITSIAGVLLIIAGLYIASR
jgi:uncharacterized membrane protein